MKLVLVVVILTLVSVVTCRGHVKPPNSNNLTRGPYINRDACGMLGGVTIGYQCLAFKTDQLSWGAATEACTSDGGRLAVPAYPQLLVDYVAQNYGNRMSNIFWVGGLQTDFSKEDSWYWINNERIPLNAKYFPWAHGEPNHQTDDEHFLNLLSITKETGYNDDNCHSTFKYICELKTSTTQLPSPVQFVIPQISSGKFIGPENVFPNITENDPLSLHFILDHNMHMTFDIVDGMWGYIRHVISGKILTPDASSIATSPMNPADGTRVVLHSDRRPWALFAIDQYQNRIIHRSGKFISSQERYVTISGDESANITMEFQFMHPNNPDVEVLPYGYPVISGDWQLVFSVDKPIATHTYSSKVTIGRSESLSSSYGFKYGFERAIDTRTSISTSSYSYSYGSRYNSYSDSGSDTSCINFLIFSDCSKSGDGSSSGDSQGSGSGSDYSTGTSSGTTTTQSMSSDMQQASSDTWNSAKERDITFTVEAGLSAAVWQRIVILEHQGHKAVHLSNIFADTNSSRINPKNFNTQQRRFI